MNLKVFILVCLLISDCFAETVLAAEPVQTKGIAAQWYYLPDIHERETGSNLVKTGEEPIVFSIHWDTATSNSLAQLGTANFNAEDTSMVLFDVSFLQKKDLFDLPLNLLWLVGGTVHFGDGHQEDSWGALLGATLAWTKFPWDRVVKSRFEFTEGLSYQSKVPWIEEKFSTTGENKNTSNLLNYLQFFFGVKLQPLSSDSYETYFGPVIDHRSGIYGLINGVHGGSNFVGVKFQVMYAPP